MHKAELLRETKFFRTGCVQQLYHLSVPYYGTFYIVISAVYVDGIPETYIFPANENGDITQFLEMQGSFRGDFDHAQALENAGYTL